jgi:purine-binding chemotaxis protein CheW
MNPPAEIMAESQLVTFLLKEEEFGFNIMSVQEIIRLPKMAKVPLAPVYVEGIANLRGVVLPVIDMRSRFGMQRTEETDRTRVLVVDIDGVKTGLRVDRVKQVTSVLRSDIQPPPAAVRGISSDYLEGIVKLDQGQRIVMALNAAHVCAIGISRDVAAAGRPGQNKRAGDSPIAVTSVDAAVVKMVTFRIAKEEFAFPMEHVREILRVQTPTQVPDVPDYVLGVLTVRGQILPVIDLRRLLQQESLAEELANSCRPFRVDYERWIERTEKAFGEGSLAKLDCSVMENLRGWIAETNSSSELLMQSLALARALNEKVVRRLQDPAMQEEGTDRAERYSRRAEVISASREVGAALLGFEHKIDRNIHEDQRIIVVDADGFVLGLVVDHVHEVLNVPKALVEPPPNLTAGGGMELSGVAKLEEGNRLIMLLDVATLMKDQRLRQIHSSPDASGEEEEQPLQTGKSGADEQELVEVQLVTFLLGSEEFGIPISQIQEIDRLGKITKVPRASEFIEGVTNLRGEVIPVLDTRKRFNLEIKIPDDRTRIIIVDLAGVKTGLVVDSVRQVLNLSRKNIAPPPQAIASGIDQQFISGIGKVDEGQRMIVLLDVEKILSRQELAQLSEVGRGD